jgi:uncharacterized protein (TIGR02246 family)
LLTLAAGLGLGARPALAAQAAGSDEDKAAIAKNAEAFIEAFHNGDAKALAAFWTSDGDYTDQSGYRLKGRSAIEKAFRGLFAENKGLKLRIESASLRFLTPDVAVEDGMTAVIPADGAPPSRARYTIVHVKKDGQWLVASVRDAPYAPPSNHVHLRGLEWIIGDWAEEEKKGGVERLSFSWSENQNFILATYATTHKDVDVASATVWIGWDPAAKHVRSWLFDSTGGFAEGSWSRKGKQWLVKSHGVHQDGKKVATTYVLTRIDADTMTFQARDRTLGAEALPDTKEVTLKRVKQPGS